MKVCDVFEETASTVFTEINVDLDGVMVDFMSMALEVAGYTPESVVGHPEEKVLKRNFWKMIEQHVKTGKPFFSAMRPMDDARVLWGYLNTLSIPKYICTATGHIRGAGEEKREWIRKHLGHDVANQARIVRNGEDKSRYASPTTILIDDRRKVVDPWVAAGGVGILHVSAANTIANLKELGL